MKRETSELFKALSCQWRIDILKAFAEKPRCMCELESEFPIEKTTLSRHIKLLVQIGLIDFKKNGTRKDLSLSKPEIIELLKISEQLYKTEK